MRKYYIWWEDGSLTISSAPPRNAEFTVTFQADDKVKNWQRTIDWYQQTQAILKDLWEQDRIDSEGER